MPDLAWAVFLWYNQDESEFEKVREWDTTIQGTMEE